jgi:hypothetical protein
MRQAPKCLACGCCPALFRVSNAGRAQRCYSCLISEREMPRKEVDIEAELRAPWPGLTPEVEAARMLALSSELNATKFLDDVGTLPVFMLCTKRGLVAA